MVPSTLPGMSSPTSPGPLHLRGVLLDGTAEGERVGDDMPGRVLGTMDLTSVPDEEVSWPP